MTVTAHTIQRATTEHYGLAQDDIRGHKRVRCVTEPRQLAMYLARQHTGRSYTALGQAFSRDHTSVIHACKSVAERIEANDTLAATADQIMARAREISGDVLFRTRRGDPKEMFKTTRKAGA